MTMVISGSDGVTFPDTTEQDTGYANGIGFRNRIINGDMRIDQRNAGASVTVNGTNFYTLDRWLAQDNTDGVFTIQQSADAPTGFNNSILFTTTTADASLTTTQFAKVEQRIEGFNVADLDWGTANAKTVTLSFWVRSSLTGNFGGAITNNAENRSYAFTYAISTTDTWEYKTVTIAGDTSGTWLKTNGNGLQLTFGLGVGPSYSGTANTWTGSLLMAPTGATSVVGTSGATWYITGVQLEVGSVATPFERRPYGTELALCQRYYYRITTVNQQFGVGWNNSTTGSYVMTTFPVTMRTAPTSVEQNGTAINYRVLHGVTATDCSTVPSFSRGTIYSAITDFTVASGLTAGQGSAGAGAAGANAYLGWSAEL